MNTFKINIRGLEYHVEPALHDSFYSVTCGDKSAMLGKGSDGKWEFSLQTSKALDIAAGEIGREIEKHISETGQFIDGA